MSSIYRRALGSDFQRLHPQIQRRFGFSSEDCVASIGQGVMEEIWRGPFYTLPFLSIGTWRRIMFPERGRDVPFAVENYAYRDSFGRETVKWVRTFDMPRRARRFDATMVYSEQRGRIVDSLGSHQHLAVDIDLGVADVCEWFDDAAGRFRIDVNVSNKLWGPLFGYRGWFDVEYRTCTRQQVPAHVKPLREERRE